MKCVRLTKDNKDSVLPAKTSVASLAASTADLALNPSDLDDAAAVKGT